MKVLYLFSYSKNLPGVNTKIISKINILKNLGVNIEVLCFSEDMNIKELDNLKVHYVLPFEKKKLPKLFNLKYLNFIYQFVQNKRENNHLKEILKNIDFDLVILRYGMANFFSYKLVKYFKHKFVFEHNTNEIEQYKLKFKNPIASHSWVTYEYFSEKIFGPRQLKFSAGIIGVTNEITIYELSRFNKIGQLPLHITISNGINVEDFELNYVEKCTNELNMVILLGVNAPWHGLDRIVNGIKNYKGDFKLTLYVIGNVAKIDCQNVIYLGYLNQEKINHFFETTKIHVAFASLALHRINIREASVLKAREYLARGLPFILGYNDTDLENNEEIKSFICLVNSDDSAIDIDTIIDFYNKVSLIENYPQKIRTFAKKKVDMGVKMNMYKDFLLEIYFRKRNIQ